MSRRCGEKEAARIVALYTTEHGKLRRDRAQAKYFDQISIDNIVELAMNKQGTMEQKNCRLRDEDSLIHSFILKLCFDVYFRHKFRVLIFPELCVKLAFDS